MTFTKSACSAKSAASALASWRFQAASNPSTMASTPFLSAAESDATPRIGPRPRAARRAGTQPRARLPTTRAETIRMGRLRESWSCAGFRMVA